MNENKRDINEQTIEQAVGMLNNNRECIFEPIEEYILELQKQNEDLMEENKQLKQQLSQAKVNRKDTKKISLMEHNKMLRKIADEFYKQYEAGVSIDDIQIDLRSLEE